MTLSTHTITVYNKYTVMGSAPFFAESTKWARAVIRGVYWEDSTNRNVTADGLSSIDKTVSIIIPKEADAGDKIFINPKDYTNLNANVCWTLGLEDIIVKGVCNEDITDSYTEQDLKKDYKSVDIKGYDDNMDTIHLPHFDVRGK